MPTHFEGRKETIRALNAYINLARASDSILARLSARFGGAWPHARAVRRSGSVAASGADVPERSRAKASA